MNYDTQDKAGFTLVEVLVAISILGMVIVPLTNSVTNTIKSLAEARNLTIASNLARLKLEEEINQGFNNLNSSALTEISDDGFVNFQYSVEVDNFKVGVKKVRVKVYLLEKFQTELVTLVTDDL